MTKAKLQPHPPVSAPASGLSAVRSAAIPIRNPSIPRGIPTTILTARATVAVILSEKSSMTSPIPFPTSADLGKIPKDSPGGVTGWKNRPPRNRSSLLLPKSKRIRREKSPLKWISPTAPSARLTTRAALMSFISVWIISYERVTIRLLSTLGQARISRVRSIRCSTTTTSDRVLPWKRYPIKKYTARRKSPGKVG